MTLFFLDSTKQRIISQKKAIVNNPDGITQIKPNVSPSVVKTTLLQTVATTNTNTTTTATVSTPEPAQKIQIIRGSDGKLSVRGLNADQKLITMSDGKFLVLTTNANGEKTKTVLKSPSCAALTKAVVTKPVSRTQTCTSATIPKQTVMIRQQLPTSTTAISKASISSPIQRVSLKINIKICIFISSKFYDLLIML